MPWFTGMLKREEERELFVRWREHGDQAALDKVILAHKPLVKSVAERYSRKCRWLFDDLMQQGFVGLLIAAEKFELERGLRSHTGRTVSTVQEDTDGRER